MGDQDTIPNNHVVAVLHGEHAAHSAIDELARAGYEDSTILGGSSAEGQIEAKGEESSLIVSAIKKLAGHLSEQVAYLEQYEEQARAGGKIVAVRVEDHEQVEEVRQTLERHGAVNVRFFGRFAVSDLTPSTNPSAPSSERP